MKTNKILLGVALALVIYLGISSFGLFTNIKGSGKLIKETRNLEVFHAIEAGGIYDIILKQGEPQQVTVETDDNIMPVIITKVKDGELEITQEKGSINATKLEVTITLSNIDEIDISGACTIKSIGLIKSNKLEIECSGATEAEMELECKKLDLDFSGASKGAFEGKTKDLEIEASGASKVDCENVKADVVSVDASGASKVLFSANKVINIGASGASKVIYQTEGATLQTETSGAADIQRKK
jgi:hypothetical protein